MRTAHSVRLSALALILALFAAPHSARAQSVDQVVPQAKLGYITDLAGVLSPSAKAQLTALCTEVQQKTQAQIAVVTIKSLGDQPIENYSIDLATKLGVGPKSDRGILILFAVDDHRYRFEVGYGLEPILPDGKVGTFGREAVPYLRQGDYDDAILLVTRLVAETIAADRGVTLATPSTVRAPRPPQNIRVSPGFPLILILVVIFVIVGAIRRAVNPVAASRYRRGGGNWWIGPMIGGMGGGLGGGLGGGSGGGGGGFGGFGGGFGGGGGGGGFGGFGGGSFGGGGASGSW